MFTYLNIVQMLISAVLILLVLLQVRGEGFSGTFGTDASVFRTRRGVEKTLFQFTIVMAILFVVISIVSVVAGRGVIAS